MAGVIDADTHIIEHPGIWEHIDRAIYPRRPVILKAPNDTLCGSLNAFWLIDGENLSDAPAASTGRRAARG